MTTDQKTQKDLPEWWDTFCEAVKTRTLDKYECAHIEWSDNSWSNATIHTDEIYRGYNEWKFRKRARTVNINGVELVAPVLAGDVTPDYRVWPLVRVTYGVAGTLPKDALVFTSASDRDAMYAALLGVKP